jgi:hypothetical protein
MRWKGGWCIQKDHCPGGAKVNEYPWKGKIEPRILERTGFGVKAFENGTPRVPWSTDKRIRVHQANCMCHILGFVNDGVDSYPAIVLYIKITSVLASALVV